MHDENAMLISQLLDLPDQVHRGDFVLNLAEGVARPEATLRDSVVTPQLADGSDNALTFFRSALTDRASKAAYLHGSFGSGKSHFPDEDPRGLDARTTRAPAGRARPARALAPPVAQRGPPRVR